MAHVVDRLEDAGVIRFRVYRSPRDSNLILASWQHAADENGMGSIGQSQLGTPVEIEYQRAIREAAEYGVPFVWVDDPGGLFPPAKRPTP